MGRVVVALVGGIVVQTPKVPVGVAAGLLRRNSRLRILCIDFDPQGNLFEYDVDNLYGIINNNEVVILQYPIVDPITFYKSDFLGQNHHEAVRFKEVQTP